MPAAPSVTPLHAAEAAVSERLTDSESEMRLLRRYHRGDLSVRNQLVTHFMPLAKRLTARYRHTGEAREDLEQVAYLGLIKAIDR